MTHEIDDEVLVLGLIGFFESLHRAITGSRRVAQFGNFIIFEETFLLKGNVYFYLFSGNEEERKQFFPEGKKAYATFINSSSTLIIDSDDGHQEFCCAFGYIFHLEEVLKEFQSSEKSEGGAEWLAVQILTHEIRHEIQLCHDLSPSQFRMHFPHVQKSILPHFTWEDERDLLEDCYRSYIWRGDDTEVLRSERDAIITAYLCLIEWHTDGSDEEKIARMSTIIQKEQPC